MSTPINGPHSWDGSAQPFDPNTVRNGPNFQPQSGPYPVQPQSGQYPAQPYVGPAGAPQSGQYLAPERPPWDQPPAKKSKKGLFIGLGALGVVAVVVAGYFVFLAGFGGIKNSAGKIDNVKTFLASAEKEWKSALPKDGISVSKSAGCYYQLDSSDSVTKKIYCGPARRSSTKTGQTWDEFSYSVSGSGDKQIAAELKAGKVSQLMPANLVDLQGAAPTDDGKDIKEPPLPELTRVTVWTSDSYQVADADKVGSANLGSDPRLVAPGIETTIGATNEYSTATVDNRLSKAANGEALYQVSVSATKGAINGSVDALYAVNIDGQEKPVNVPALSSPNFAILISAPKDSAILLVLNASGYKQSIDVRTGKRSAKPANPLLYSAVASVSPGTTLTYPKQPTIDSLEVELTATITSASLAGYDSAKGFPDDGKAWLTIKFTDQATIYSPGGNSGYTSYKLGCSAITANGVAAKACTTVTGNGGTVIIAVDAAARSFAISMPFDIHGVGSGKPDFDVSMAAQSTTIAFG